MTFKKLALFAVVLLCIHQITASEFSDEDTFPVTQEPESSEEETKIQPYIPPYHPYYEHSYGYYPPPPPPPSEFENGTYNLNGTTTRPGIMGLMGSMYPMMSMDPAMNGTSNAMSYAPSPYAYMPPPPPPPMYQQMYPTEYYNPDIEPEIHQTEVEEL